MADWPNRHVRSPGRVTVFATLAALLLGALPATASDAPTLRFDPFRPRPATDEDDGRRGPSRDRDRFEPILRSVVVAGPDSLANLGGEILAVGETARGYRLVAVREFEADFEKDGASLTLPVESGR